MPEQVLALPYYGPSHHPDVLERLVTRQTCRLDWSWPDLPNDQRNALLEEANHLLTHALRELNRDLLVAELKMFGFDTVASIHELNGVEHWITTLLEMAREQAFKLSSYQRKIEGR
ncbi:hypothetical protein [Azospirillum formosense]|uniref:hypothetical protein n=1 Tax=Azospirillum formosense TaxID=861533 RepID=UPI001C905C16|nr:hypothetical protein [Azospirillum formosense]MBY3757085.1 hypothetical protein [Azospirillum formosense]